MKERDLANLNVVDAIAHELALEAAEHGEMTPELQADVAAIGKVVRGHLDEVKRREHARASSLAKAVTMQPPGRTPTGGRIAPSAAWVDAFEAETPAAMKGAARFAERRALALVLAGGVAIGDELVLDAIGDTFTGDVTWDPHRVSLTQHVRGVIAVRVRHEIARQAKIPHLPMTGDLDSGDGLDMVAVAASRVVAADEDAPPERIAMRASAASATAALRRMASGDADVIAILDAFEAECYSREEIRDVTGLTVRAYDNARRRLAALADKLPPAIRIGLRLRYL